MERDGERVRAVFAAGQIFCFAGCRQRSWRLAPGSVTSAGIFIRGAGPMLALQQTWALGRVLGLTFVWEPLASRVLAGA